MIRSSVTPKGSSSSACCTNCRSRTISTSTCRAAFSIRLFASGGNLSPWSGRCCSCSKSCSRFRTRPALSGSSTIRKGCPFAASSRRGRGAVPASSSFFIRASPISAPSANWASSRIGTPSSRAKAAPPPCVASSVSSSIISSRSACATNGTGSARIRSNSSPSTKHGTSPSSGWRSCRWWRASCPAPAPSPGCSLNSSGPFSASRPAKRSACARNMPFSALPSPHPSSISSPLTIPRRISSPAPSSRSSSWPVRTVYSSGAIPTSITGTLGRSFSGRQARRPYRCLCAAGRISSSFPLMPRPISRRENGASPPTPGSS